MAVLCPSCAYEAPQDGPAAGAACPTCGRKLVAVEAPKDELIGAIVDDRFEVISRIGQGGMGRVYKARQRSIGREIALKVIDRRAEADVQAVKRFFREAQLASQLSHPNSVSIIEFGQHTNGQLYLAMELVRGKTLLDVVQDDKKLPVWRVVRIGVQLCDALEAAHALSIVHRDLKLDNVMVLEGTRDHVKVLDFGLARSLVDPQSRATTTGVVAGTPRYLAPEVALRGAEPAPAQDIYALGVMLGELSLGRELWKSTSIENLLSQKMAGPPDLAGMHPRLRLLVESMISNEPTTRPRAADVRADLLAIEELKMTPAGGVQLVAAHAPTEPPPIASSLIPVELPTPPPSSPGSPFHAMPSIDAGLLVGIDEVPKDGDTVRSPPPMHAPGPLPLLNPVTVAPPPLPAPSPVAVAPTMAAALVPAPTPAKDEHVALELEHEWGHEKAAKAANPFPEHGPAKGKPGHAPARGSKSIAPVIVGIVGLALIIGGGLWWQHHKKAESVIGPQPGLGSAPNSISIKFTGDADSISVDNQKVGKPPLTMTHARDGKTLMVSAQFGDRTVWKQVVADRDQEVELELPGTGR